jgi:hypothetical protein
MNTQIFALIIVAFVSQLVLASPLNENEASDSPAPLTSTASMPKTKAVDSAFHKLGSKTAATGKSVVVPSGMSPHGPVSPAAAKDDLDGANTFFIGTYPFGAYGYGLGYGLGLGYGSYGSYGYGYPGYYGGYGSRYGGYGYGYGR